MYETNFKKVGRDCPHYYICKRNAYLFLSLSQCTKFMFWIIIPTPILWCLFYHLYQIKKKANLTNC
uniref:Uncharacterized protein n=1 Tax=Octopus bimaculoides TaxID=37653 RepID=A0A0L8FR45_OCTBM